MIQKAIGIFHVQMTPLDQTPPTQPPLLGRMALNKQFEGNLQADSKGQMITAVTPTDGSAGYVAIEQVTGTLNGRKGSFILQHNGIMNRGEQSLTITIVPDSGTDELIGLSGTMTIAIDENGKHHYNLAYHLLNA